MGLTASNKGTYVFDEAASDGNGILRYSRLINGERETPKPLDKVINTGKRNAHPFITTDEFYIMWDGEREGGYGDNDPITIAARATPKDKTRRAFCEC